jgi:hypothetical protein
MSDTLITFIYFVVITYIWPPFPSIFRGIRSAYRSHRIANAVIDDLVETLKARYMDRQEENC